MDPSHFTWNHPSILISPNPFSSGFQTLKTSIDCVDKVKHNWTHGFNMVCISASHLEWVKDLLNYKILVCLDKHVAELWVYSFNRSTNELMKAKRRSCRQKEKSFIENQNGNLRCSNLSACQMQTHLWPLS